jgi:EmrB/QacA subfamily drug resistance transporter
MEQIATQKSETVGSAAPHAGLIFAIVLVAGFLDVVDFSIVQVALPTIQRELIVSLTDSQWIIGAYGLTMAGFLMLSGRAGDIYGQKRLFIAGLAVFSLASLTAGFAPSLLVLVASRAVQGVGAAITTATALSILASTFPEGKARNRAFGIFIAVLSAGFAAAALAGGVLTASFGWRSVMFVNVPIGAAAVLLSQRYLAKDRGRAAERRLDLPGALAVTSGLMLLVYALTNAADNGFSSLPTLLPLGLSALILAGFLVIEARSKAPLMPLGFLRRGTVMAANVLGLIVAGSAGGLVFLMTIFLQQILGYSALNAGLAFLPAAIIFFVVGGWGAAWFMNRLGMKPVLVLAMALITAGSALLTQISVAGGYLGILPGMLLWSLGASIGFPAMTLAALAGTQRGEEGLASGLINTSMRVGGPLGLAVLLTVASVGTAQTLGLGGSAAVVAGFQYAFLASTLLSGIGLAIALLIGRKKGSAG